MELIERETLLRRLRSHYNRVAGGGTIYTPSMMLAITDAERAPTIDPIRAAGGCRCGECRWGQQDDLGVMHCHKHHTHKKPSGYCDDGEPREVKDDD